MPIMSSISGPISESKVEDLQFLSPLVKVMKTSTKG